LKVVVIIDSTHNPFDESHRVSCWRENLTSSFEGGGLEMGLGSTSVPRSSLSDKSCFTAALIQAASGTQDSHNRVRAAEALWHHAADLQFADETSISALEQLATDTDARVQKAARQALEDMKQFRQRNSSP
jgi:HEAT repeat protein